LLLLLTRWGHNYYALRHNYEEGYVPLVIRVRIDLNKKYVYVDGRDFLYTVFGMWDKRGLVKTYGIVKAYQIVSNTLKAIYGDKVHRYFEKASKTIDSNNRISLCDLAVHDLDVALAHANNRIVIRGRYNVTFKSSFFVEAPITPDTGSRAMKRSCSKTLLRISDLCLPLSWASSIIFP